MSSKKIGVFVGSLRRESFSRSIANAAVALAPADLALRFIEIGGLPMFNQDFDDDGNTPEAWTRFREEVAGLDGFLFVTPEYNRSMPAVLKMHWMWLPAHTVIMSGVGSRAESSAFPPAASADSGQTIICASL